MLNFKRNKRAFTIIELLVVIAILGILVLLATPKFLGYVEKANLARIKSDVKVAESVVGVELIYSGNLLKWGSSVDVDLEKSKSENKLYDTRGYVTGPIENGPYWKIDQSEFKSKLEGNFYANQGGKVYYEEGEFGNAGELEEPALPEDNIPVATDADFTWVQCEEGEDGCEFRSPTDGVGGLYYKYSFGNETGNGYYRYTGSAKEVKIPHTINGNRITNYYGMFYGTDVTKVVSDNPNVTDMSRMFTYSQAAELDLSSFDTSKVTNMAFMFAGSQATTLDLSSLDTSNVVDMSEMFAGSWATSLDLSSLDTSNVTDMSRMFAGSQATTLDLSSLDTSNVTDMSRMFTFSRANSLDLSLFDTSNVTNMSEMFAYSRANSLDLSSFDTSNVTNMSEMFSKSQATSIIGLNKFNTSNVKDMSGMFIRSQATSLDLSSFDTPSVINMGYMFYESQATSLDLSSFDTSKVTDMSYMFYDSRANTGYARTHTDADKLNSSSGKPAELNFVVK